jgi:sugar O-acyltransferase (sialic acid O-acetyltransferase NeuD family)
MLIFGAGGHARKVITIAGRLNLKVDGLVSTEPPGTVIHGHTVLGYLTHYLESTDLLAMRTHIAIGENSVRHRIYTTIQSHADKLLSLISTASTVASDALIGNGTFVGDGAVVQTGARVGICTLIDTAAILEHDVVTGNFVTISPGAVVCGASIVRSGAILGAGATVIEKVTIGENSLVGAGSVVLHDVEPNVVVVGNPARVLRARQFSDHYLR